MTGSLLLRGMLVGVLAGLIAFVFAYRIGEPQVDLAIAFEEQMAAAEAPAASTDGGVAEEEAPLVSRETQATTGLVTGLVGFGAAIGGIFALVFSVAYGRLGALGARATAALLATAGFVSVSLVPLLKYPANPPAVGYDDTVGSRTVLFFVLLVISVALMTAAVMLAQRLWRERGVWNATVIAGATFVVATAIVFAILPPINEMPEGFNPLVIWNFRIASLGIHLILWTVIGLGFGVAAERLLERRTGGRLAQA
ncbi:MAG: CbtA family protein [Cypionkella sp.]|nr:CbtA family protein [Cypionkella sp.]